jgi:flagellar hook-associated protein 1
MIGNLLNTARSAILAHQAAVQVTAQNVANAHTPGYSRQRIELSSAPSVRTAQGVLGSGVVVSDVSRVRDTLLDTIYRREVANASGFGVRKDLLEQVEEIFGELSDSGFAATLDSFWASWSELAANPLNPSARGMVHKRGEQLAFALNNNAARIDALGGVLDAQIHRGVDQVNRLVDQVAQLNRQIAGAETGGRQVPELRDRRDSVLDELASQARITVSTRNDGSVAVHLGTATLVDGPLGSAVSLDSDGTLTVGTQRLHHPGGSLGALLDLRHDELPGVAARLDLFAHTLVTEINALHMGADGVPGTGLNFFDPNGLSAAGITLSTDVDDPTLVALIPGAPGDNTVAYALASLKDKPVDFASAGTISFNGFYNNLVTDVGVRVNAAARSEAVYTALSGQADARKSSVSGVSTEEEMMSLMRHQQAYQAATRLVQAADDMMRTILDMV